jgi:lipoate-protein ligase A
LLPGDFYLRAVKFLDRTLPTPAENVAEDERLLDAAERGDGGEVLRVWESPTPFVVVGYAQKIETEVNVAACAARGVPVLRRCSGGGTVVQGPGCLSYALVLRMAANAELRNVTAANCFIMERQRAAVEAVVSIQHPASSIQICGDTDLVCGDLKFSGNAQRRRRNFLLFHGTFLLDFDLALVSELLPQPSRAPNYRAARAHADFLTNLKRPASEVKLALKKTWSAVAG